MGVIGVGLRSHAVAWNDVTWRVMMCVTGHGAPDTILEA